MANIFEVPQPGNELLEKADQVRLASIKISQTENLDRIKALNFMADYLEKNSEEILKANKEDYKKEILGENTFRVSIEASSQSGWKNIVGKNGVTIGMTTFGKSGPYKEVYKLFNLTSDEIVKITKSKVKK